MTSTTISGKYTFLSSPFLQPDKKLGLSGQSILVDQPARLEREILLVRVGPGWITRPSGRFRALKATDITENWAYIFLCKSF